MFRVLRFAVRNLNKHLWLFPAMELTLMLGIGISSGVLAFLDPMILRPQLDQDFDSFAQVDSAYIRDPLRLAIPGNTTVKDFGAVRDRVHSLQRTAAGAQNLDTKEPGVSGLPSRSRRPSPKGIRIPGTPEPSYCFQKKDEPDSLQPAGLPASSRRSERSEDPREELDCQLHLRGVPEVLHVSEVPTHLDRDPVVSDHRLLSSSLSVCPGAPKEANVTRLRCVNYVITLPKGRGTRRRDTIGNWQLEVGKAIWRLTIG